VVDHADRELAFLPVFPTETPPCLLLSCAVRAEDEGHVPEPGGTEPEGLVEE